MTRFICVDATKDIWVNVERIVIVQPGPSDGSRITTAGGPLIISPLSVHEVLFLAAPEVPA